MFAKTRKSGTGLLPALAVAVVLVIMTTSMASAAGPVVHRVSVGGPDICVAMGAHPGCDGNFSLVAIQYADGSVGGQYSDRSTHGDGFHAVVDCVSVVGNEAWISGVITHGRLTNPDTGEVWDMAGEPISTRVRDNGTSANSSPDQISFSWPGAVLAISCLDHPDYEMFDVPQGQVTVR